MTTLAELAELEIKSPTEVNEDGFITIWNLAAASCDGDLEKTRALAAQFLGFLCKHECDFVVISTTGAEYLDAWFERDNKLLYDWKPESEMVDVMAQHAEVPCESCLMFLDTRKFNPKTKYSPRRIDRVEWFTNKWSVG